MISSVPFLIREATAADNILLADLGWKCFEQAFAATNNPSDMAAYLSATFIPTLQAAELADPQHIFWLVYTGEELIGYVKLFTGATVACISSANALKISRLYLAQAWWGQGIGLALLRCCLQYAQENKYTCVWLTVWEHNERALALYQKLGFTAVGEEDFVLGQDVQRDFIMEKVL